MSLLCAGGGRIVPADMLEVFLEYLGALGLLTLSLSLY